MDIESPVGRLGQLTALTGFALYAAFAPHSVAAAEIAVSIAVVGWLLRTFATRRTGLHRTEFDLPIFLFLLFTFISSVLSQEPDISIAKLKSSWIPLVFYVTQAVINRRAVVMLIALLILTGVAGTVFSLYDLAHGRGVVVESLSEDSPFRALDVKPGDTIWRVDGKRIQSTTEIDEVLKQVPAGKQISISLITQGEHVERPGLVMTTETLNQSSPGGVFGSQSSHRFRASGWTRHYETYSELLQMIAQLALGLALANLHNHGTNRRFRLAAIASALLGLGIALTAMRTVLVAFAVGACLLIWRSVTGKTRLVVFVGIVIILAAGSLFVWRTRAQNALALGDASSSLRTQVARVGVARIREHPIFGHGMDAVHRHWNEWGFPGKDMVHLHSTPLQIAFDRGLLALAVWLWLIVGFWIATARAERESRDSGDTNRHGVFLGILGALTGFLVSSLVNYNYGDAEVALLFWWLMGIMVALRRESVAGSRSRRQ
jgi:O-antigen ligase